MRNLARYIASANEGRGKPMVYTLVPLSIPQYMGILQITADVVLRQLSIECHETFVQLFDMRRENQRKLHDYHLRCQQHCSAIPPNHLLSVQNHLHTS